MVNQGIKDESSVTPRIKMSPLLWRPEARLSWLINIYDHILAEGLRFHEHLPPLPAKGKQDRQPRRTGHNLLVRLHHYKPDVLRFLYDSKVPFTNNDTERDLRMMKCKQKISGGFRSSTY